MKIEEKKAAVEELTAKLKDAQAFYLTDFTGLNVKSVTELRRNLRNAGVEYIVVKNTLAQRVLDDLDLSGVGDFFKGPTGLVIGKADPVTPAKILDEFARTHDNKPAVKAGVVERKAVTAKEVERLAKLPPREQLLAELAGVLSAPASMLLGVLQAKLNETLGLFEALRAQREGA